MNPQPSDDDDEVRRVRQLVGFLGILLAVGGQLVTYSETLHDARPFPASIWISLVGVALLVLSAFVRPGAGLRMLAGRLPRGRMVWIVGAASLAGLATFATVLFERNERVNFIPAVTFWLGAGLCYVAAFVGGGNAPAWRPWLRSHRNELFAVGAITLLAAVLRFHELGLSPRIIDGDEGRVGLAALSTVGGRLSNPFALWENFGALYLQAINMSMSLLGTDAFGLRFLPALGGTLAVPALYLFAREVAGRRVAILASLMLAFLHTHLHFSRIASVAYIQGTWLGPLGLYLLLSGLQKRSSWRAAAGGVLLGVHFSVYLTAPVLAAMLLVYLAVCVVFLRGWFRAVLSQVVAFAGGFVIMMLPWAVVAAQNPGELLNRLNRDGSFQSGWLTTAVSTTGHSALQILGERVLHAFLSLIYYPSIDFYGSPEATLSLVSAVLFLLGAGIAVLRTREPGILLLNGYFWSAPVAIGIMAIPPSSDTYRMLMAVPAALVMAGMGLDALLERLGLGFDRSRRAYALATTAVLASLLAFNAWTYYGDFAGRCRFGGSLPDRFASYLGMYVRGVDNQSRIYLLSDDNYRYGTHLSVDFLSQKRPIINYPDAVDTLQAVSGETILANPDRVAELETWAHANPGGELEYIRDCTTVIMLAYRFP